MGKLRNKDDGLGWPEADTRVRVKQGTAYKGQIVYVTRHPASKRDGIVVSNRPGEYHGHYATEWEELGVIDNLTNKQRQELANEAWKAAEAHGYCKEAKNVLNSLGLPQPVETVDKTLKVKVNKNSKITVYADGILVGHVESIPHEEW